MTRTAPRTDGSLALKLDFGPLIRPVGGRLRGAGSSRSGRGQAPLCADLRLAQGPNKYKLLEQRRRRAQIAARRLLEVMEGELG